MPGWQGPGMPAVPGATDVLQMMQAQAELMPTSPRRSPS